MEIPVSIFKDRIKQVEKKAKTKNLSAMVVYASGSGLGFAGTTHGTMRFLCDWDARNQAAVLILQPDQAPILLVPGRSPQLFAKEIMWFEDIRIVPQSGFGKEIVSILTPLLADNDKVGYLGKSETPVGLYDTLREGLPRIELIAADSIVDELRTVKDSHAIGFHRRSAALCDNLFEVFKREVRSGKPVFQIQADLEHAAKIEGAEYASSFMSIGPVADRPRYAKRECTRIPSNGDQVLLALFVFMDGHWGHSIRTGFIGKPGKTQQRVHDIVHEMQDAALEQMVPGHLLENVWKASETVLDRYYPGARELDWYWLKTGHSLGLDYSDPILSSVFPTPAAMRKDANPQGTEKGACIQIMPGMLFELHPNIFLPGEATSAIGDMVLVTETGHEILTRFPRGLLIL
jgi:Xaa-Pro aminopeptidase